MIDTIVLNLPEGQYVILKPERFYPNAKVINELGISLVKSVNNPTAQDKRSKHYRPRLTLMKRTTKNRVVEKPLRIEFSVPKVLYGNNVNEVEDTDFDAIISHLRKQLSEIGVEVFPIHLRNAPVSAVHFSKNIELQDGYTASLAIKELAKINLPKRFDLNRDSFRNDGRSLQYYTNAHSLVFYDKIYDIKKPGKRAIDKDQNYVQMSLFEPAQQQRIELLRMEARLSTKVKLNALFGKLGLKRNPTFQEVFHKATAQLVLRSYWQELIGQTSMFIFEDQTSPKKILKSILKGNPNIKPKQAVFLTGLKILAQDGAGVRELREMLAVRSDDRTWQRIVTHFRELNQIIGHYHGWVEQIIRQLDEFEPYKHNLDM